MPIKFMATDELVTGSHFINSKAQLQWSTPTVMPRLTTYIELVTTRSIRLWISLTLLVQCPFIVRSLLE